jgi:hypothetical protein
MWRVGLINVNRAGIVPCEHAGDADVKAHQLVEERAHTGIMGWVKGSQ